MLHQGEKFTSRFDAGSYLRIVNAWQSFNLPGLMGGDAAIALQHCKDQHWLLFSIDSDVCYYPEEQMEIALALKSHGVDLQYITVHSDKGHDSFLLEPSLYTPHIVFKLLELYQG